MIWGKKFLKKEENIFHFEFAYFSLPRSSKIIFKIIYPLFQKYFHPKSRRCFPKFHVDHCTWCWRYLELCRVGSGFLQPGELNSQEDPRLLYQSYSPSSPGTQLYTYYTIIFSFKSRNPTIHILYNRQSRSTHDLPLQMIYDGASCGYARFTTVLPLKTFFDQVWDYNFKNWLFLNVVFLQKWLSHFYSIKTNRN